LSDLRTLAIMRVSTIVMALCLASASAFSPSARSAARLGVRQGATLGDFTATTNAGAEKKLSDYEGKVVLIENVASL